MKNLDDLVYEIEKNKALNIHVVSKSFYCKCNEPLELRMIPNGTPYCEECGKNIKQ